MKYVIMAIVSIAAAAGLMLAAYGKEGLKYRKEGGANDYITAVLMAVLVFFWGQDLINFINSPAESSTMTYVFVFGAPILLLIWIFSNRSKISKEMKAPPKPYKKSSKK